MRYGRFAFWFAISIHLSAVAAEPKPGNLFIIGGGLRPDNAEVYRRLIESAGGRGQARLVLFPTAATSANSAQQVREIFQRYGIPPGNVTIVDLMLENADRQAYNTKIIAEIRRSTGAFFTGGDQSRITRSLLQHDGTATPVLLALKHMWQCGGVIAGTSAGAAIQSSRMLSVSGLPDDLLDEGMDALDFGIRHDPRQRGLLVTQGLGFFRAGIVDQHFSQHRGRLGRLARALIAEQIRFGFGVDENTAMVVAGNGQVEVVGNGNLTIVDAKDARCDDGPLGCRISGVRISCLQRGDRFNPADGKMAVHPQKAPVKEGTQAFSGNYLITDIAAPAAIPWAMISGLAENSSRKQEGITLTYNRDFGHGYRFTLVKTDQTVVYGGYVDNLYSYAVDGVRLDISPIVTNRQDPRETLPLDLPSSPSSESLESLWFRGILLADDRRRLRPNEPILRAEFANALAQSVHLPMPRQILTKITDVAPSADRAEDIYPVVAAGLLKLDSDDRFRPSQPVTRLEAAQSLIHLAFRSGVEGLSTHPLPLKDEANLTAEDRAVVSSAIRAGFLTLDRENRFRPAEFLTRQQAADALYRLIGFSWKLTAPPRKRKLNEKKTVLAELQGTWECLRWRRRRAR